MLHKILILSFFTLIFVSPASVFSADCGIATPATAPAVIPATPAVAPTPASVPAPVAMAPAIPTVDPEDPGTMLKYIIQAVKESRWAWFVGLLLMLATFIFNKILKDKIPRKVLPWVAIGLGVGSNVALSFAAGLYWLDAIGNGLSLGLAAAGGWSAVGKLILGNNK